MSSKVRVYEVARDLGMANKDVVALLQSVGVTEARNHMSAIAPEAVERVKRQLEKQTSEKVVEERIRPTVVKRRSAPKPGGAASDAEVPSRPSEIVSRVSPVVRTPVTASAPQREQVAMPPVRRQAPVAEPPKPEPAKAAPAREVEARVPSRPAHEPPVPAAAPAPSAAPTPQVAAEPVFEVKTTVSESDVQPALKTKLETPAVEKAAQKPAEPVAAAPPAAEPAPASSPVASSRPPEVTTLPAAAPPSGEVAPAQSAPPVSRVDSVSPPVAAPVEPPRRKTGIDVWEGRPGVPMPQAPRSGPAPRRVQYDAKAGANSGPASRQRPFGGPSSQPMGTGGPQGSGGQSRGGPGARGPRHRGIGSLSRAKGSGQQVTQERSAHKKVVRIEETISLQSLAGKIGVKATELLMKLIKLGMTGVNINSGLDIDTSKIVAGEFGWEVENVAVSEEDALVAAQGLSTDGETEGRITRPPIVTVMGHVDHGKTSLLDAIRKENVVSGEAGGITQHIGAYSASIPQGKITFLDTPGHEAFTAMRARGARATDIVILVVAADDGVMPQTREAVDHARAAKAPIVVAINKCDKPEAQPERVRRELSEIGLVPEEWGGDTLFTEVSAVTGQGLDTLLEQVLLQAEILELDANPNKPASGVVVEAELDRGRGPVATVLVTDGTLHRGDVLLVGGAHGKVRALLDPSGRSVASAGPSDPVIIIGLNDVPSAGDPVHVVRDAKKAQEIADGRKKLAVSNRGAGRKRVSLDEMAEAMKRANQHELKVIVKADVQGSVEALTSALNKLSGDKVRVTVVLAGVGAITESDINLAVASKAIVIGFNARPAGKAGSLAQKEGVEIRRYSIIYDVVDDIRNAMEGLLEPELVKKLVGKAEIRQLFRISKAGVVAGCMVTSGVVRRSCVIRLVRGNDLIWEGKLSSLKRFKDDAKEVKEGFDCGMSFEGFNEVVEGDVVEAYDVEQVRQTL